VGVKHRESIPESKHSGSAFIWLTARPTSSVWQQCKNISAPIASLANTNSNFYYCKTVCVDWITEIERRDNWNVSYLFVVHSFLNKIEENEIVSGIV